MYYQLRKNVLEANKKLGKTGLVKLNWGNISEYDRKNGVIAIKPSGVDYNKLKLENIPIVDINGKQIYGNLGFALKSQIKMVFFQLMYLYNCQSKIN